MTTRAPRALSRVLAVLALSAPMAAVVVAASTSPAFASGSFTSPAANAVFDDTNAKAAGDTVSVKADVTVAAGKSVTMTVVGPGYAGNQKLDNSCFSCITSTSGTITISVPIKAATANGEFTATLSGDATGTRNFYTNFKPTAVPSNVTATSSGTSQVDLTWSYAGTEPDLTGFTVYDNNGNSDTVPTSACSNGTCSYTKSYDNPAPGTYTYTFTVTALRSSGGCSGCGTYTESDKSAPSNQVQLVTPQSSPTPTPSASASGGTSAPGGATPAPGATGAATDGRTKPVTVQKLPPVVAQRKAFALSFNHFSPSLGIPKLPPLPATTFQAPAPADGTYQPTLPYATPTPHTTTTNVLSSPLAAVTSLNGAGLARSLAVALVLLVCAAHIRVFLTGHAEG